MYKQKDNTDLKPRSAVHKPDTLQILYDGICQIDRYWHFTNCIEKTVCHSHNVWQSYSNNIYTP